MKPSILIEGSNVRGTQKHSLRFLISNDRFLQLWIMVRGSFNVLRVRHMKQLPQKVLHGENEAKFKAKPQQHEYMWKCMAWPECVGYTFIYLQSSRDCTHNIQTIVCGGTGFFNGYETFMVELLAWPVRSRDCLVTLRKSSKIKSLASVVKYYLFMAFSYLCMTQ